MYFFEPTSPATRWLTRSWKSRLASPNIHSTLSWITSFDSNDDREMNATTARNSILHYIKFKVKNAEVLQTLHKHYNNLETMETTPRINEILVWFWRFAGNLMRSLQLANCSMFVQRRRETLGRRQCFVQSLIRGCKHDDYFWLCY